MSRSLLAALAAALCAPLCWGSYLERDDVRAYMDELVAEHGFERGYLEDVFSRARHRDSIIAAISRPAEKAKPWHEYRDIFITDTRIDAGVDFWQRHADAISRAAAHYGVRAEIIVAILGVETLYGRYLGSHRVIDALATLAFGYPRRSAFFRGELTQFLLLAREEGKDPLTLKGSYAGAMGYGQFIPSSYRNYAVDFDGDGLRDIWQNETDAIGSIANYFRAHGWRGTGPVAVRVEPGDGPLAERANSGLELTLDVGELRRQGIPGTEALPDAARGALFRMEAEQGREYWLGLHDFHVITRYNRSGMYALAVLQLSEALRGRFEARTGS